MKQRLSKLTSLGASQLLALILSLTAIGISYVNGTLVAYNDASAHLNTARRVIDSLTPGPVQLGSVWLPLLHILLIPLVSINALYHTGLAGSIVSGASYLAACYFAYKLVYDYTHKHAAAFIGTLALALNLNFLYMQTTAMFEPLLIALAFASVYYLSRWSKTDNDSTLVIAALFVMLSTITRYDGWAFAVATTLYVAFITIMRRQGHLSGKLILFSSLAYFGIALWLLYNGLIFGNPLYFQNGPYSAQAQQIVLRQRHELPTDHNAALSAAAYGIATILNLGIVAVVATIAGVIYFLTKNFKRVETWGPLLLLVPLPFNILALYLGQSVIWLPMIPPYFHTYFNARYGILLLPAVAFFIGYIAAKNKIMMTLAALVVAAQTALFLFPSLLPLFGTKVGIVALKDTVSSVNQQTVHASTFLHDNYDKGLILCSTASSDALIYRADLPLKDFITEGTAPYWKNALRDPASEARWLIFFPSHSDSVGKAIAAHPQDLKPYVEVYSDQTYQIWRLKN